MGVSLINGHLDNTERCVCCGREIPEGRQYCVICGKVGKGKQTNYDRIRNMSVEEMAEFMYETNENCENFCAFTKNGKCNSFEGGKQTCFIGIKEWFEAEVTE